MQITEGKGWNLKWHSSIAKGRTLQVRLRVKNRLRGGPQETHLVLKEVQSDHLDVLLLVNLLVSQLLSIERAAATRGASRARPSPMPQRGS